MIGALNSPPLTRKWHSDEEWSRHIRWLQLSIYSVQEPSYGKNLRLPTSHDGRPLTPLRDCRHPKAHPARQKSQLTPNPAERPRTRPHKLEMPPPIGLWTPAKMEELVVMPGSEAVTEVILPPASPTAYDVFRDVLTATHTPALSTRPDIFPEAEELGVGGGLETSGNTDLGQTPHEERSRTRRRQHHGSHPYLDAPVPIIETQTPPVTRQETRRRSRSVSKAINLVKRSVGSLRERFTRSGDGEGRDLPVYLPGVNWCKLDVPPNPVPPSTQEESSSPVEFSTYDFMSDYFGFSHFSPHAVVYDGKRYPTVVHLLQSFKFRPHRPDIAERVRNAGRTPFDALAEAHAFGKHVHPGWLGALQYKRMLEVLVLKFSQHPYLRSRLLSTGRRKIIHISNEDRYWGCGPGPGYRGKNMLGVALQNVRDRLRGLSP
ncbi:hypothetical protein BXZ70DRAFT_447856 [Cristinia sonorae]|uniref:NADAR domain-containing protein n=1 Tax=Cristinia sonorae TaxID=1940300 RepID=A0A8K0UJ78_9AGAR|nr:hypothetical protein BXZ70DRAFT_447856 [Cristinia sonorae]